MLKRIWFLCFITLLGLSLYSCSKSIKIEDKPKNNIEQKEFIKPNIPILDSIKPIPINKDSLDRVQLIRDSIKYRKLCIKVNGGLNGFKDRYKIWLRARNTLKNKHKNAQ